jgi:hypothetical protein
LTSEVEFDSKKERMTAKCIAAIERGVAIVVRLNFFAFQKRKRE